PFKSANVIAVPKKKDGKPTPITDLKEWEKFFKENARPVKTEKETNAAVEAWMRAAAELNQDGFYTFTVKFNSATFKGATITAIGTVTVDPKNGDKGDIKATLTFKDGTLATAE